MGNSSNDSFIHLSDPHTLRHFFALSFSLSGGGVCCQYVGVSEPCVTRSTINKTRESIALESKVDISSVVLTSCSNLGVMSSFDFYETAQVSYS